MSNNTNENIIISSAVLIVPTNIVPTNVVSVGELVESCNLSNNDIQFVNGGTVDSVTLKPLFISSEFSSLAISSKPIVDDDGNSYSDEYWMTSTDQYVFSGGTVNNVELDGYTYNKWLASFHGGIYDIIYIPARQYVFEDGLVNGGTIYGGQQYIASGGVVNNIILNASNNQGVVDGHDILGAKVEQYISSGGIAKNTSILRGTQYVSAGGEADGTILNYRWDGIYTSNVAEQRIFSSGVAKDTLISSGYQYILSGGIASNTTLIQGVISVASGGTTVGDLTISSGGSLYVANGGNLEGNITLNPGGSVTIGLSNGGSVDLVGDTNSGLIISGYTKGVDNNFTTIINGFSGQDTTTSDKVRIAGLQTVNISSVMYPDDNHIKLGLLDGTSLTLNMVGIKQTGYSLQSDTYGTATLMVCFLSGTMIKMAKGVCAVEDIQVGATVLTYDPKTKKHVTKKVTWVGKKSACVNSRLPDDQAGYPVRILKDTFKKDVPNKDLLITPEHCLFIDGYFVPARMLVNGRSIYYDYSITNYDFYHIETEDHSVIWADGMLTESYLNTGNRHKFNTDQKVVSLDPHVRVWENDAIAPLNVDRHFVEPVFNRLVKCAIKHKLLQQKENNFVLCKDHGLYLLTEEGQEIYQIRKDRDKIIFNLPANTQGVYLVSRKSRPCDVIGPFIDDRCNLGVLVGQVDVFNRYGVYPVKQYLKHTDLKGWSVVEQSASRWTIGCAFLPLDVYNTECPFAISIEIISAGPYLVKKEIKEKEKIAV